MQKRTRQLVLLLSCAVPPHTNSISNNIITMIIIDRCFECIQFQLKALRSHIYLMFGCIFLSFKFHSFLMRCSILTGPFNKTNNNIQRIHITETIRNTEYVFIIILLSFSPLFSRCFSSCNELVNTMQCDSNDVDEARENKKKPVFKFGTCPVVYARFVLESHTLIY